MERQQFIDNELENYIKQFPDATDAELDDIFKSSSITFDSQIQTTPKEKMTIGKLRKLEEESIAAQPRNPIMDAASATGTAVGQVIQQAPSAAVGTAGMLTQFPVDILSGLGQVSAEIPKRLGIISPETAAASQEGWENMAKAYGTTVEELKKAAQYTSGEKPIEQIIQEEAAQQTAQRQAPPEPQAFGVPGANRFLDAAQGLASLPFQPAITIGHLIGGAIREATGGESPELQAIRENAGQEIANLLLSGSAFKGLRAKAKALDSILAKDPTTLTPEEQVALNKYNEELNREETASQEPAKQYQAERPKFTEEQFEDVVAKEMQKKIVPEDLGLPNIEEADKRGLELLIKKKQPSAESPTATEPPPQNMEATTEFLTRKPAVTFGEAERLRGEEIQSQEGMTVTGKVKPRITFGGEGERTGEAIPEGKGMTVQPTAPTNKLDQLFKREPSTPSPQPKQATEVAPKGIDALMVKQPAPKTPQFDFSQETDINKLRTMLDDAVEREDFKPGAESDAILKRIDELENQAIDQVSPELLRRIQDNGVSPKASQKILEKAFLIKKDSIINNPKRMDALLNEYSGIESVVKKTAKIILDDYVKQNFPKADVDGLFSNASPLSREAQTKIIKDAQAKAKAIHGSVKNYFENPVEERTAEPAEPTAVKTPEVKEPRQMTADEFVTSTGKKGKDIGKWNAANEKAYVEGKPLAISNRPDWSLTSKEFEQKYTPEDIKYIESHKDMVKQALSEGKPVPPEVLAEYPDLKVEQKAESKPKIPANPPNSGFSDGEWQAMFEGQEEVQPRPKSGPGMFGGATVQNMYEEIAPKVKKGLDIFTKKAKEFIADEEGFYSPEELANAVKAVKDKFIGKIKRGQSTQVTNTINTYAKILDRIADKAQGKTGDVRIVDVSTGLGMSEELAKNLGYKKYETTEPFPAEGFVPTYKDSTQLPDNAFDFITNNQVLNVVPKEIRDGIVKDIGRALKEGGTAIISTRGKDVMAATTGRAGEEPMSLYIPAKDAQGKSYEQYQKGFTNAELKDYVQGLLGEGFDVKTAPFGAAGVEIIKTSKSTKTSAFKGKDIGGANYLHKKYESDYKQFGLDEAKSKLPKNFEYNIVKYDRAKKQFSFIDSPDFDKVTEPTVGDIYTVSADGEVKYRPMQKDPDVYHGKFEMVKDDYDGFDKAKAKADYEEFNKLRKSSGAKSWGKRSTSEKIRPNRIGMLGAGQLQNAYEKVEPALKKGADMLFKKGKQAYETVKRNADLTRDMGRVIDITEKEGKPVETEYQPRFIKSSNFKKGAISFDPLVDTIKKAYREGREKVGKLKESFQKADMGIADNLYTLLFERFHPVLKPIKKTLGKKRLESVFGTIERSRYADNVMRLFGKTSGLFENMAKKLQAADLDLDDLGTYAQAARVYFERSDRNIQSRLTKDQAAHILNNAFPDKQKATLKIVFDDLQKQWQDVIVKELVDSQVFDPTKNAYLQKNKNYSRDVVIEKVLEDILDNGDSRSKDMMQFHLKGTSKDILNPVEQMIQYAHSLAHFSRREVAKKSVVDALKDAGIASDTAKEGYELVKYKHKGEWVEKYLPHYMAQTLMDAPAEMHFAIKWLDDKIFNSKIAKAMTRNIIVNPSFAVGNSLMLDPITTWAQMPSVKGKFLYPIVHALSMFEKAGSPRAGQLAKMFGIESLKEAEKKMAEGSMLNVGSLYSKATGEATELGDMMSGLGLNQNAVEFFTGKKANPLKKAYGGLETAVSEIDNTSKVSLYRYLQAFESWRGNDKIAEMVREMGTPATKRSGVGEPYLRRGTLFGNAILQAGRATAKNFADSPVQFTFSNMAVPTALAYGIYNYMTSNPENKKRWDSLSEYQKKNFLNIDTGLGTKDKPTFFSLPLPRIARIFYGIALDILENDKSFRNIAESVASGLAQGALSELPSGASRPIALATDVGSYLLGKNPYDYYRKQNVIPQNVMDADATVWNKLMGDSKLNDLSTTKAFGKYLLNTYGLAGWWNLDALNNIPAGSEWTKAPGLNRLFRVGGPGVSQKLYEAKKQPEKIDDRARLIISNAVKDAIDNKTNIKITSQVKEAIARVPDALGRTITNQLVRKGGKQGNKYMTLIDALKNSSIYEKMEIFKAFEKMK